MKWVWAGAWAWVWVWVWVWMIPTKVHYFWPLGKWVVMIWRVACAGALWRSGFALCIWLFSLPHASPQPTYQVEPFCQEGTGVRWNGYSFVKGQSYPCWGPWDCNNGMPCSGSHTAGCACWLYQCMYQDPLGHPHPDCLESSASPTPVKTVIFWVHILETAQMGMCTISHLSMPSLILASHTCCILNFCQPAAGLCGLCGFLPLDYRTVTRGSGSWFGLCGLCGLFVVTHSTCSCNDTEHPFEMDASGKVATWSSIQLRRNSKPAVPFARAKLWSVGKARAWLYCCRGRASHHWWGFLLIFFRKEYHFPGRAEFRSPIPSKQCCYSWWLGRPFHDVRSYGSWSQ